MYNNNASITLPLLWIQIQHTDVASTQPSPQALLSKREAHGNLGRAQSTLGDVTNTAVKCLRMCEKILEARHQTISDPVLSA